MDLPIEIWQKIFSFLILPDLFNVSLVCKKWNYIVVYYLNKYKKAYKYFPYVFKCFLLKNLGFQLKWLDRQVQTMDGQSNYYIREHTDLHISPFTSSSEVGHNLLVIKCQIQIIPLEGRGNSQLHLSSVGCNLITSINFAFSYKTNWSGDFLKDYNLIPIVIAGNPYSLLFRVVGLKGWNSFTFKYRIWYIDVYYSEARNYIKNIKTFYPIYDYSQFHQPFSYKS